MKTVGYYLCLEMIIMLGGLQGNHSDRDRNNESDRRVAYNTNDLDHRQRNIAFKLYPYHTRLNKRFVA